MRLRHSRHKNFNFIQGNPYWETSVISRSALRQCQMRFFGEVALPAEPVLHGVLQLVEGNVGADFHLAVRERKSVVEDAGIGEVAHGETVEPLQRARKPAAVSFILDANLAGEHSLI